LGGTSVYSGHALGTPQIIVIDPFSPQPVGTCVKVRAKVTWDSDFRSMRIRFGNEGWQESAEIEFERTFCTNGYAPGWYTIRVEVARQGDNSWSNPTSTEAQYQLTEAPKPYGPPISEVSFNPSGGSQVGQNVTIHIKVDSANPGAIRVTTACGSLSHVETTVPEFDDTWYTFGCGAGSQNVHVCARDVNDPNWAYATCVDRSYNLSSPPPSAPTADFWSDSESIQAGQCTTLLWVTGNASSVDIDGTTVNLSGSMQVCPSITKYYSLKAVGPGGEATRSLAIQVYAGPVPTSIPDPTQYFTTGDVIQISNDVFVIVDSHRRLVPNPETLDALGITRAWINNKGFSDDSLRSIPQGPDIPDVNRDYAGFVAFKNAIFPNTTPIIPITPTSNPATLGFNTGDVIQIGNDVFVIVDGQRRLVPNPETLDALGIPRSWINNKGFSDAELSQIPKGPDIPDVNRDPSGFQDFKNRIFPNTTPIIPQPGQPPANTSGISLVASPSTVTSGYITVSWSGLSPTGSDWISLHPAGAADSNYIIWKYAQGSSGSLTFDVPPDIGQYEFRLFRNGQKVCVSNVFTVGSFQNTGPTIPQIINPPENTPSRSAPEQEGNEGGIIPDENLIAGSGYDPTKPNLITVYASESGNPFIHGQCTELVYDQRPDVSNWINIMGNYGRYAYRWDDIATFAGVPVDKTPQVRDIVVFHPGCYPAPAGTSCKDPDYLACGHVGLVVEVNCSINNPFAVLYPFNNIPAPDCVSANNSNFLFIKVFEQNVPLGAGPITHIYKYNSCMQFIHEPLPSGIQYPWYYNNKTLRDIYNYFRWMLSSHNP